MNSVFLLVPLSLLLGFLWVLVFLWTLDKDQYSDLKGSSQRILYDEDKPLNPALSDDSTAGEKTNADLVKSSRQ